MRRKTNAEQMRERNAKARKRAFQAYGGPKCACCGEEQEYFHADKSVAIRVERRVVNRASKYLKKQIFEQRRGPSPVYSA